MTTKESQLQEQLRNILLTMVPLLQERPQMFCGNVVSAEVYLLAFDHISEQLCGKAFYRPFLFELGFGAFTFTSRFQSNNHCATTFSSSQHNAVSDKAIEARFLTAFSEHLTLFHSFIAEKRNGETQP